MCLLLSDEGGRKNTVKWRLEELTDNQEENGAGKRRSLIWQAHFLGITCFLLQKEGKFLIWV